MAKKPSEKMTATDLTNLKQQITAKYGDGSIMTISDGPISNVYAIPTNIASLDNALGIFGIPEGRIIELYGAESSGKTTTCLEIIASFQSHMFPHKDGRNGVVAFIDAEHALDTKWATSIGVDVKKLLVSQPNSGDEALRITEDLVDSGLIDLIVIDSVAALTPKEEIDGDLNDSSIGAQARLMSKALRKLVGKVGVTKTTIIFINQTREKIGVMFGCLHANTLVNFVDGKSIPIKTVVEERITGQVWSYNEHTKSIEPADIIDWHHNGDVIDKADYINISACGPGNKNGRLNIAVTPTHEIMTNNGWRKASDITNGDLIMTNTHDIKTTYAIVSEVRTASNKQMKQKGKYDITVDKNHNYTAGGQHNGIIVHNSPETTPGGKALRFYTSVRMQITKGSPTKNGDKIVGFEPKIKVVKNKMAPPFREATYRICFGTDGLPSGIDKTSSLVDEAAKAGIVTRKSSSYSYNDKVLGNGLNNAARSLDNNKELFDQIYNDLKARMARVQNTTFDDLANDDTFTEIEDTDE
jgi:protein RecA